MISRSRRIARKDFPAYNAPVFQWTGKVLRFRATKDNGERCLFAIITAKKHYKTKVSRNLTKRRIAAEIQAHFTDFDHSPYRKILIFPIISTKDIGFEDIAIDFEGFISKLNK